MELNRVNAQFIMHIKTEESYWRQKSGMKWFSDGDNSTNFFHSVINSKRKKLTITRIKKEDGTWIDNISDIADEAIQLFEKQFSEESVSNDTTPLRYIPRVIDEVDNNALVIIPTLDEVKKVVFSMNASSAPGPDGFTGKFFQHCWNIIAQDLYIVILEFFNGKQLPMSFSHSSLVLISKIDCPQEFTDFRPISLSNVINKIISKLLNNILTPLMSKIISPNQSGFMKNRSISDNIILTQELFHNMKRPNINGNVIFKLDMTKAFDRVSWNYLCLIMRRFGFSEI